MGRATRAAVLAAATFAGAQAFAPASVGLARPSLLPCTSAKPALSLRMAADEEVVVKPLIPTLDKSMAPDYSREQTQFERQGLVDSGVPIPKTYGGPASADGGFGGLTRREFYAMGGAISAGVLGVAWAFTRNPGYDRKSDARAAGKVTINAAAVKDGKVQAAIEELKEARADLQTLYDTFKKDKNAQLSEGIAEFEITSIRNDLNAITFAAFDEDTQILTDRLTRNIIQDLVELETAVKLKAGVERSPKRVASTQKRFAAALDGFDKFLAYFK